MILTKLKKNQIITEIKDLIDPEVHNTEVLGLATNKQTEALRDALPDLEPDLSYVAQLVKNPCAVLLLKCMCWGSGCLQLKSEYAGQIGGKENLLYFRCR